MTFPNTPLTLIQRLASLGGEEDWRLFLRDYWRPICRFALYRGAADIHDAEDVTLKTFQVLWENRLLVQWISNRTGKLRTLLCGIARRVLANRGRVRQHQDRLLRELAAELDAPSPETDAFYAAWAEDVVQRAVEAMAAEYYRANQGNRLRVFYGRLCQRLRVGELAEDLGILATDVVNYYRAARQRLAERLQDEVRRQVERYCPRKEVEAEYTVEWRRLADYFAQTGGLEEAVRRAYDFLDPVRLQVFASSGRAFEQLTASSGGGGTPQLEAD